MLVPDGATRSVVFIGWVGEDGDFVPMGTGFLVLAHDHPSSSMISVHCLVTAEHVVSAIRQKGRHLHCRLNRRSGGAAVVALPDDQWWVHPDTRQLTDVAVLPFAIDRDVMDHDYIHLVNMPVHADRKPRLGEEVMLVGLFKSRAGKQRNLPVVRIGNIAAVPGEPIRTKYCGDMQAYLVEIRSIAGLSGSPVFKYTPGAMPFPEELRPPRPVPRGHEVLERERQRTEIDWLDWQFVGLVHGHFDVKDLTEDGAETDVAAREGLINTGIGIIVPYGKVLETLFQPEFWLERRAMIENGQGGI